MKSKLIFASLFLSMAGLSAQTYQVSISEQDEPMMKGKFEPTWSSLENYQVPEWFRNVKFGIWAHWGPQCVEGSGDWMARSMYMEGTREYEYHVKHYGHPSEVGFKDIIPLWKAENWDPDKLVAFYKKIGAQYFFALGNHHDNMDLWDSKYQPWNSVNMGPKKDILAGWEKAARKYGLYFGVSLHADHAWSWYEPSQRHDTKGPKKGIPYDGKLTKADGKGKWWEGYDPQDLYAQNHPLSENSWDNGMIHRQWAWGNGVCVPSQEYCTNFYNRTLDVINRYNPDLLYFDVTVAPFYPVSDAGLKIAAHFYNHNMATHKGKLEAVLFGGYWWLAHFCTFLHLQLFANQQLAKFCSARQIPNGTKTGQNHRKIKSRTLQARHPLSWTSLFCAKVQFCPVKNKQNPANMLPIKHLYYMCIFRKILQVLHAQTCVAYFKDLLKSVLCHLYTTVLPLMRIALEQCTTHLPLSAMRKYVFHQQIGKKCHMAQ